MEGKSGEASIHMGESRKLLSDLDLWSWLPELILRRDKSAGIDPQVPASDIGAA